MRSSSGKTSTQHEMMLMQQEANQGEWGMRRQDVQMISSKGDQFRSLRRALRQGCRGTQEHQGNRPRLRSRSTIGRTFPHAAGVRPAWQLEALHHPISALVVDIGTYQ